MLKRFQGSGRPASLEPEHRTRNTPLAEGVLQVALLVAVLAGAGTVRGEPPGATGERRTKELPGPTLTVRPVPGQKRCAATVAPAAAKLEQIVIPALQVENKSAREVLALLVAMAKHEDPEQVGINLLFQCSAPPLKRRVTMDITNLKLADVLRYVCQACGLDYVVEQFAVVIVDQRK
jgi:hypothetical protein